MRDRPVSAGLVARSALLHAGITLLYVIGLVCLPLVLIVPRRWVKAMMDVFIRCALWLLKNLCGMRYDVRGREHLPAGPVLFACKHQSQWEAVVLPTLLGDVAVVAKARFLLIPLYGQVIYRMRNIIVSRTGGALAAAEIVRMTRERVSEGRSILIFPEGTRTPAVPYPPASYRTGIVAMYRALGVPCVPIALNSGLFWPRKSLLRHPGTVVVEILPAISPGLASSEFMARLVDDIETASRKLVSEGSQPDAA